MRDLKRIEEAFMTLITSGDKDVTDQARFIVSHQAIEMHDELLVMREIVKELAESDPLVNYRIANNNAGMWLECGLCVARHPEDPNDEDDANFVHEPDCLWLAAKKAVGE